MRILVTNDDGIEARGIKELVSALSGLAEVYVFVPDSQRSACGHSITVWAPIEVKEVDFQCATRAWALSGTPADCVKMGLRFLKKEGIQVDLVCSGINHGSNLGTDTLYSGTVSGAIEGVINGIPSIAISVDSHEPAYFEGACRMALKACELSAEKLDNKTVLNINLPDIPWNEIQDIRVTRLGPREYDEWFNVREDGHFHYSGAPVVYEDLPEDMDVMAIQQGCVSITPLHVDMTSHSKIDDLKNWGFAIEMDGK